MEKIIFTEACLTRTYLNESMFGYECVHKQITKYCSSNECKNEFSAIFMSKNIVVVIMFDFKDSVISFNSIFYDHKLKNSNLFIDIGNVMRYLENNLVYIDNTLYTVDVVQKHIIYNTENKEVISSGSQYYRFVPGMHFSDNGTNEESILVKVYNAITTGLVLKIIKTCSDNKYYVTNILDDKNKTDMHYTLLVNEVDHYLNKHNILK